MIGTLPWCGDRLGLYWVGKNPMRILPVRLVAA